MEESIVLKLCSYFINDKLVTLTELAISVILDDAFEYSVSIWGIIQIIVFFGVIFKL